MAERVRSGSDAKPAVIRGEIARTRAALADKLGALKQRILGTPNETHERKKSMASTKAKAKADPSGAKTKKSTRATGENSKKSNSKKQGASAKRVMGEVLAGAAVGALKGAAEALPTPREKTKEKKQ